MHCHCLQVVLLDETKLKGPKMKIMFLNKHLEQLFHMQLCLNSRKKMVIYRDLSSIAWQILYSTYS